MQNVSLSVKGSKLTIEIDLSAPGTLSKSCKTLVIASTHGNAEIPGVAGHKLGLNLYKPKV